MLAFGGVGGRDVALSFYYSIRRLELRFPNVRQWGEVGRYAVSEGSSDDSPLLCYLLGSKRLNRGLR
jgi:hypothetical protein